MTNELPRQKQQIALSRYKPDSHFTYEENGEIFKVILIVPGEHRGFIYLNKNKSVTEAKEQLATDYLTKMI